MRHLRFTWNGCKANFKLLITISPAFQFKDSDIARIRKEMTTLVDNLSKVYLPWLKEQELADMKAKQSASLKDSSEVVFGDDANEVSTEMNKDASESNVILNDDDEEDDDDDKSNFPNKKRRLINQTRPHGNKRARSQTTVDNNNNNYSPTVNDVCKFVSKSLFTVIIEIFHAHLRFICFSNNRLF